MERTNIAGIRFGGGRRDNFYFSLLEYYPEKNRWFLRSLFQVQDEALIDRDLAIAKWIKDYSIKQMVVDFPLTLPACETCELICQGEKNCKDSDVVKIREKMNELLEEDAKRVEDNPKRYEQERNSSEEITFINDLFDKKSSDFILSKGFKRRLKRGYVPYWNRVVDFYVWAKYYDPLLKIFNVSYDSFGQTSLKLFFRYRYLKRHFPKNFTFFESNHHICLIELLRAKIIDMRDLRELQNIDDESDARRKIVEKIEERLDIFIYDRDFEILIKNARAFESFLLSIVGQRLSLNSVMDFSKNWAKRGPQFIFPQF